MQRQGWHEVVAFAVCFCGSSVAASSILLGEGSPIWMFLLLQVIIATTAFELSELLTAALSCEQDLPRLECDVDGPRVALLYLVCDDLVPAALGRLGSQTYPHADVFVLDDSRHDETRRALDATPFRVVRRTDRSGHKAGNVNHWLRAHGARYDYFAILDSDSIVAPDFVSRLLRYAEHPANRDVAVFNTLPLVWNTAGIARWLAIAAPLRNWVRLRLANRMPSIFSTGHNNLHRTGAVLRVGGFEERFIAEDIALTLRLVRAGYASKLVNVTAWEAEPEDVFAFVGRLSRWAAQTIEIHRADWGGTPFLLQWQMFRQLWRYSAFFLYPLLAVIAAWLTGIPTAAHAPPWYVFVAVLAPALLPALVRIPLVMACRMSIAEYVRSMIVLGALAWYASVSVCAAQLRATMSERGAFGVTPKRAARVTLRSMVARDWQFPVFVLFIAAGFGLRPGYLPFTLLWVAVLFGSPLLVYLSHGRPRVAWNR